MADTELDSLFQSWMTNDWSEPSREATRSYYEGTDDDRGYLKTLLSPRIAFGTAGLRAEMLPGFANFNHVTVRQAVLGLADYLVEQLGDEACSRGVIVGHDHRAMSQPLSHSKFNPLSPRPFYDHRCSSLYLAELVARTLKGKHISVTRLDECHTPLVPFAVIDQKAAAGVMITASHNPKTYNGLKVYWQSGCQINHPHDEGIAAAIDRILEQPLSSDPDTEIDHLPPSDTSLTQEIKDRYNDCLQQRAKHSNLADLEPVMITCMHGVGAPAIQAVLDTSLSQYASRNVSWVKSQKNPDPAFPTVAFPNPEEKGALDLAMQQADSAGTKTILAVDPDADRFAAAEKISGRWHRFTGNEIGVLLVVHVLEDRLHLGSLSIEERRQIATLTTAVSSAALKRIAEAEGFYCEETLTGFKWMANRAQELEQQGYNIVFAFEEALGYMFPDVVYDKDGVAALLEFLVARHTWKTQQDMTPMQKLDSIYKKYGYHADANTYVVSPNADSTNAAFATIRDAQRRQGAGTKSKPAVLGHEICKSYRDLTTGVDTSQPNRQPRLPVDPKTHMISCEIGEARFTVRGSGTEPKVKLYVESRGSSLEDAQDKADKLQKLIIEDWLYMLKA